MQRIERQHCLPEDSEIKRLALSFIDKILRE
jgi:hypothetical protein